MKIKALKTFLFLAENNCDFNEHAVLNIPRSTAWAHISALEKETGLTLVYRHKQNAALTAEGKAFAPYALKILESFEEGTNKARLPESTPLKGKIIISTTKACASGWVLPSLKDFQESYPHLQVIIIANDSIIKTIENNADIVLRPIAENSNLRKRWFITYHHGLFASQDYLDRRGTPKTPEDLRGHSVLGYGHHDFSYFETIDWHITGKFGIPRLTPSMTINSTTALFQAAAEGYGICSATVESNQFYHKNLVRVLPQVKGPSLRTYFCMQENAGSTLQENAGSTLQENVDIFMKFFEEYLIDLGIKIEYEKT